MTSGYHGPLVLTLQPRRAEASQVLENFLGTQAGSGLGGVYPVVGSLSPCTVLFKNSVALLFLLQCHITVADHF